MNIRIRTKPKAFLPEDSHIEESLVDILKTRL